MVRFIQYSDNNNLPILGEGNEILPFTCFNLVKLRKGEQYSAHFRNHESVWVVMSGNCDFSVEDQNIAGVGQRKDIWSGRADSVYVGMDTACTVTAGMDTEIAIAGGYTEQKFPSFRILPEEVEMVDVGSEETHTHRQIFHILGHNGQGRAGNLLVSELFCSGGNWSGYPAHKHDTENPPEETAFEEVYHYRFNPENGFGGQFLFDTHLGYQAFMTRSGDTFAFSEGYHPTVTSPGHDEYIFTILVGKNQRSLIQNFREEYRYMMDRIPGIGTMRDKFK